jgi:hypothetical protein
VNSFTLETRVVRNTTSVAANQRPANRRFNQTSAYPRFFGVEGDIGSFHLSGSTSTAAGYSGKTCPNQCFTIMSSAGTDWLATTRGRVGVAANNWLLFVTGALHSQA